MLSSSQVLAEPEHDSDMSAHSVAPCKPSPIPGKRPPDSDCAVLVQKQFTALPSGNLALRIENFGNVDAAQSAATPASAVVEAGGKICLLTLLLKDSSHRADNS